MSPVCAVQPRVVSWLIGVVGAENPLLDWQQRGGQAQHGGRIPAPWDATAGLAGRAASGGLTLRVAETLPLERFRGAYTRLERGGLPGKIVLTP